MSRRNAQRKIWHLKKLPISSETWNNLSTLVYVFMPTFDHVFSHLLLSALRPFFLIDPNMFLLGNFEG